MNLDSVNKWLTLGANFGVLVGIFALVIELQHSSRLAQVNAYQTRNSEIVNAVVELALSEELSDILTKYNEEGKEALTASELRRVRAWYRGTLRRRLSQYYQYQQGFLDEEIAEDLISRASGSPYQTWADLDLLSVIDIPEFRERIEQELASQSGL